MDYLNQTWAIPVRRVQASPRRRPPKEGLALVGPLDAIEEHGRYDGHHQSDVGIDHTKYWCATPAGNSAMDGRVATRALVRGEATLIPSPADCASASNEVRVFTHISTAATVRRTFATSFRDGERFAHGTKQLNGGVRSLCLKT